jgi:NodT family efflux transporter outer membrane factor (OMF) lipoprotein
MKLLRPLTAATGLLLLLAACAVPRPPGSVAGDPPPRWYASLPHGGTLADLRHWWQGFQDPLLAEMVEAAQVASPDVATAGARIAEARSARVAAQAALLPSVDASLSATRGNQQAGGAVPLSTVAQAGLQTAWEIDLFGGLGARSDAARARLAGSQAAWHEARVAVAAETATTYVDLRTCERQLAIALNDEASRAETARLTALSAEAGFTAPAVSAQARASAAEGAARSKQQRGQCELTVKALVALTGMAEPVLRQKLAEPWTEPAGFALAAVPAVPAELLAQRPDVYRFEREVEAASADVGAARADRYPRLTLSGQVAAGVVHAGGRTLDAQTWAIGPLALSLPVFDAGRRAAAEDAATARYEEAAALYAARVRQAVREVEEALVNLQTARERSEDVRIAVEGYRASFVGTESRYRSGLGSLIELEDQRRVLLVAENAQVLLQRDRLAAWIALYRAVGGGWVRPEAPVARNDATNNKKEPHP